MSSPNLTPPVLSDDQKKWVVRAVAVAVAVAPVVGTYVTASVLAGHPLPLDSATVLHALQAAWSAWNGGAS